MKKTMPSTGATKVQIGCRYAGRHLHADKTTGIYAEVLPRFDADAAKLQRALLANNRSGGMA